MRTLFGDEDPLDWQTAFREFWSFWTYKVGRGAAERAYRQLFNAGKLPSNDILRKAVEWQTVSGCLRPRESAGGDDLRPHPGTWLNGLRWEDERPPSRQEATEALQAIRRTPINELSLEQVESAMRCLNLDERFRAKLVLRKVQILAENQKGSPKGAS